VLPIDCEVVLDAAAKAEAERRANPGSKTVVLDYGGGGG